MKAILVLNRATLFVIGIVVIVFYLVLNRIHFMEGTAITKGEIIGLEGYSNRGPVYAPPMVHFITDSIDITFHGETNTDYREGEIVPVIYKLDNPSDAYIYSFLGFWLGPVLYCILPLMVLTAVVFSFMGERDRIVLRFERFLFWKNRNADTQFFEYTQIDKPVLRIGEDTGDDPKTED